MLELLFRGFFEWIYGLIVDIWGFIAGGLLDIMGLDFAYIQSHIPIMDDMARRPAAAGQPGVPGAEKHGGGPGL